VNCTISLPYHTIPNNTIPYCIVLCCNVLCYTIPYSGNFLPAFRNRYPETSVRNYQYSLRNDAEERSSHLLRGRSLKSRLLLPIHALSVCCCVQLIISLAVLTQCDTRITPLQDISYPIAAHFRQCAIADPNVRAV